MTGRSVLLLAFILLLAAAAQSEAISITASVDRDVVALGDQLILTVSVEGSGGSAPDPIMPELNDFDVSSRGRSTNFSLINGKMSSTLTLDYALTPKKTGKLIIDKIYAVDGDEKEFTDPIVIEVTNPQQISQLPNSKSNNRTNQARSNSSSDDFFIRQQVSKGNPYYGEQITWTIKFYQATTLFNQPTLELPEFEGFLVEDLQPNTKEYENVNGRRYLVTGIKKALFPISKGKKIIDSPKIIIEYDNFRIDPFSFFGSRNRRNVNRQPDVLVTNPITIDIQPLPSINKPDNFNNIIGQYRINANIDKDSVGVEEPITLKIELTGTGNIKSIPPLDIPEMNDFKIYESGKTETINNNGEKITGKRTFELAVIPKTSGTFTIPSMEISFFNPNTKKYQMAKTKPLTIKASGEGLVDVGGAPKNIISARKRAFEYIVTDYPQNRRQTDWYNSPWFWLIQVLPLIGIAGAFVYRSHYRKVLGDTGYARKISASKKLRKLLKKAEMKLESSDFTGFYGELYDAMVGYIADRLNLEKEALILDDMQNIVQLNAEVKSETISFLEKCQAVRFSIVNGSKGQAQNDLRKGLEILGDLEKAL